MIKSDELFLCCKSIFNDFLDVMQPSTNWRRLIQAETDTYILGGRRVDYSLFPANLSLPDSFLHGVCNFSGHFVTTFHSATHAVNIFELAVSGLLQ